MLGEVLLVAFEFCSVSSLCLRIMSNDDVSHTGQNDQVVHAVVLTVNNEEALSPSGDCSQWC